MYSVLEPLASTGKGGVFNSQLTFSVACVLSPLNVFPFLVQRDHPAGSPQMHNVLYESSVIRYTYLVQWHQSVYQVTSRAYKKGMGGPEICIF